MCTGKTREESIWEENAHNINSRKRSRPFISVCREAWEGSIQEENALFLISQSAFDRLQICTGKTREENVREENGQHKQPKALSSFDRL